MFNGSVHLYQPLSISNVFLLTSALIFIIFPSFLLYRKNHTPTLVHHVLLSVESYPCFLAATPTCAILLHRSIYPAKVRGPERQCYPCQENGHVERCWSQQKLWIGGMINKLLGNIVFQSQFLRGSRSFFNLGLYETLKPVTSESKTSRRVELCSGMIVFIFICADCKVVTVNWRKIKHSRKLNMAILIPCPFI